MPIEVEQKFRVADVAGCERRLAESGVKLGSTTEQVDEYFNHPSRDFAQTDEGLRIRRSAGSFALTFKGPKLDARTKSRQENEMPLVDKAAAKTLREILIALGFKPVAEVRKIRRTADISRGPRTFELSLDDVERVGTFVELETLADESDLDAARSDLESLAAELGLKGSERRGYLELLLAKR